MKNLCLQQSYTQQSYNLRNQTDYRNPFNRLQLYRNSFFPSGWQKTTYKFKKVVCEEILRRVRRYSSANKDIPFKTPLFIYSVTTPFFVYISTKLPTEEQRTVGKMNVTAIANRLQNSFKIKDNNVYGSSKNRTAYRYKDFVLYYNRKVRSLICIINEE
jgi:hypothetical protein